jgi:hypothetical protein
MSLWRRELAAHLAEALPPITCAKAVGRKVGSYVILIRDVILIFTRKSTAEVWNNVADPINGEHTKRWIATQCKSHLKILIFFKNKIIH